MTSFDFIFMLTDNDKTVSSARAYLWEALVGGAKHIGFKDVGLPIAAMKLLIVDMKIAGASSYLEVVSLDEESELRSARAAIEMGVDWWSLRLNKYTRSRESVTTPVCPRVQPAGSWVQFSMCS